MSDIDTDDNEDNFRELYGDRAPSKARSSSGASIRLETQYGVYSVSSKDDPVTISDFFETLVIPVLLASGFLRETIDDYMG